MSRFTIMEECSRLLFLPTWRILSSWNPVSRFREEHNSKMDQLSSSQPEGDDTSTSETPAERTVAVYDSIDDIERALNQFGIEGDSDWVLKNYDTKTTVTAPNKIKEEAFRLSILKSYDILDTEKEQEFEIITNECKQLFKCPIAVVSLVDMGRQWFKSVQGLPVESTPRCQAFCAHVVKKATASVMVVPDATKDFRFVNNPLVTSGPKIRFYAGAPIIMPEGAKIGSLCVIDTKPHPEGLSPAEQEQLIVLAQEVVLAMVARA